MSLDIFFYAALPVFWGGIFWMNKWHEGKITAINKADKRMKSIMEAMFLRRDWHELLPLYEAVSFDDAIKCEERGLSCLALYHPRIQALFATPSEAKSNVVNIR